MMKAEKISAIVLSIFGIVLVVDTIVIQFFNLGIRQNSLVLTYCIALLLLVAKFQNIIKKKYVMIPMYIMIA